MPFMIRLPENRGITRTAGSSPSQPTYVSESDFYVQTLNVVQILEQWIYLPNLYIQYLISCRRALPGRVPNSGARSRFYPITLLTET